MTVRKLEKLKKQYEERLARVHEADADPNIIAVYISDLQYAIVCIENEIAFEKSMRIFKYTLYAFVLIVIVMVVSLSIF